MAGQEAGRTGRLSLRSATVVLLSLAVFATFCNSLWNSLQQMWADSGDFLNAKWEWVVDKYGQDEGKFYVYGITLVTLATYWGLCFIYIFMDLTNWPKFICKYKVQPGTNEPPVEESKLLKSVLLVFFNQMVVGIPVTYLTFHLMQWRGMPPIRELPTFQRVICELLICNLIQEIAFYYLHRVLHLKFSHLKLEWTSPVAALSCHPFEYLLLNMMPILLGPLLLGSHMLTSVAYFVLAIAITLTDRSGYHLPFAVPPELHDFHHFKWYTLRFLDRFRGTVIFREITDASKGHKVTTSRRSDMELYPDDLK